MKKGTGIIKSLNTSNKIINLVLDITDACNFRCNYCLAGHNFSNNFINKNNILDIILLIKELCKIKKEHIIKIIITGGEPTLYNEFFYLLKQILFLNNKKINIRVNTNGFALKNKNVDFKDINYYPNIGSLKFNITFHFNEYFNKIPSFINSIRILLKYNINFSINFLLPDNVLMNIFLEVKDNIINELNLNKNQYNFNLIKDTFGNISKKYKKEYLELYYKNIKYSNIENVIASYDNYNVKYDATEIWVSGLNKFKGYECYYISDNSFSIFIGFKGYVNFATCNTLNHFNYSINEAIELLKKGEKKILCCERRCLCELDIKLKKIYFESSNKINKIEKILNKIILKDNGYFKNIETIISLYSSIKCIFKKQDLIICIIIEKRIINNNYMKKNNEIGIYFYIKNINNIILNEKDMSLEIKYNISKLINNLFILQNIYNNLLIEGKKI